MTTGGELLAGISLACGVLLGQTAPAIPNASSNRSLASLPAATADRAQRLYVVALDDHSQPVTDLTEADFRVVDRGKAQQILSFAGFSARRQVTVILLDMLNEALPLQEMGRQGIIRALQGLESADRLYLYLLTNGGELFPVQPLEAGATPALPAERPWTLDIQPLLQAAIRKV